jgi:hypothetical protein
MGQAVHCSGGRDPQEEQQMRFISLAKLAAAVAVLATVLAACVVVEEGPGPGPGPIPGPGPRPDFCTREYAPVCAVRGGDRQTFGNECVAQSEGYRVIADGECRRSEPAPPPQVSCTMQYDPVCAVRGRDRRTFGNACEADVAGYEIIRGGECRRG